MKVLVATSRTQGQRRSDFDWCVEGELVFCSLICATDRDDPDGGCGCGRAFVGLASGHATTSAMVRELRKFTYEDYVATMEDGIVQQGFPAGGGRLMADWMLELIAPWPHGTIVERRLDEVCVRAVLQRREGTPSG